MIRTTRVGRSPRGRNPSIRVQIPASPLSSRPIPMPPAVASQIAESPVLPGCNHSEVEDLGNAGIVEFYRCRRCHAVVVVQGNGRWVVPAAIDED